MNTKIGAKRNTIRRFKEEQWNCFHYHGTGHAIDFENTQIIAEEKAYWKRLIIEGMEITKFSQAAKVNLQMRYEIDPIAIWDFFIESIKT